MVDKQFLKKYVPLAVVCFAILIFLVIYLSQPKPNVAAPEEAAWPVNAMTLKQGTYTPFLILYGRIESPEMAEKKARIEADVARVDVREGKKVKKGQVLLELDDRELQLLWRQRKADVDDLKAQIQAEQVRHKADQESLAHEKDLVKLADTNVKRREHLLKTLAGSELALDESREEFRRRQLAVAERQQAVDDHVNRLAQLQAKLMKADALLGLTNIEVEKTNVKAPFDGRVTRVDVSTGDRVNPGDTLIQIYDSRWTEVRCQIPEQYIHAARDAVEHGRTVEATTTIHGNLYHLVLTRLAGRAEKGRLGVDALFRFKEPVTDAVMGNTVPLHIQLLPIKDVFAVPITALFGGSKVYKIEKQRLLAVSVTKVGMTEIDQKEYFLIKSSELETGSQIITTQLPNAITGLKVEVKNNSPGV